MCRLTMKGLAPAAPAAAGTGACCGVHAGHTPPPFTMLTCPPGVGMAKWPLEAG